MVQMMCFYFVLTVFSTVGFGAVLSLIHISPLCLEIIFANFIQVPFAVVICLTSANLSHDQLFILLRLDFLRQTHTLGAQ